MQRNNPAPAYNPNNANNDDQVAYIGGSKGFYDRNPGQLIDPASLYSDPNMGGGAKGGRQGPPQGERMVRGPNGNMYNPNELPSNLRMETGGDPRKSPNGRAVFADDYVLKPSDQGYMSNDLPRPMLTDVVPQFDRRGRADLAAREIVGDMRQGPGSGDEAVYAAGVEKYGAQYTNQDGTYNGNNYAKNNEDFQNRNMMRPQQQTSEVAQPLMNEADMPPLRHVNMSTNQQQVPQGIASLSNMRYGDSQRQQAFGNEQQRLLNQMNQFGLRPARGR
jgi:hypothetical protein